MQRGGRGNCPPLNPDLAIPWELHWTKHNWLSTIICSPETERKVAKLKTNLSNPNPVKSAVQPVWVFELGKRRYVFVLYFVCLAVSGFFQRLMWLFLHVTTWQPCFVVCSTVCTDRPHSYIVPHKPNQYFCQLASQLVPSVEHDPVTGSRCNPILQFRTGCGLDFEKTQPDRIWICKLCWSLTAVKCLIRVFSYINWIRKKIFRQNNRIRIGVDYTIKILDWISVLLFGLPQRWAESCIPDSDSAPAPRFKTPAPTPKIFETSTPTPVNTPKNSKSLFCLMMQNIHCGYFVFDRTQMVCWLLKWLHDLFLSVNLIRESSLKVIYFILVSTCYWSYLCINSNKPVDKKTMIVFIASSMVNEALAVSRTVK